MLAILFLLLSGFWGVTLVRFFMPNIRRHLVACVPSKRIMQYIPDYLFTIPTGVIVGLMSSSFVCYYVTLALSFVLDSPTACKNTGVVFTCILLVYLSASCRISISKRTSKLDPDLASIPTCSKKSFSAILYDITILVIVFLSAFIFFYSYKITGNNLTAGATVFSDLSPHTAMISSFGVGFNFPTQYMHFSGDGIQYHFFFYYLCGILQFLGFSIDFAINIPSIIVMACSLSLLGLLAIMLTGKRLSFVLAPLLVLFRSSLNIFLELQSVSNIHGFSLVSALKYVFSYMNWYGDTEYDSWGIWAINVYANQRHFMLGMAVILILIILFFPNLRRMSIALSRENDFKGFIKTFIASKHSWLWHENDPINPVGSLLLAIIIALIVPYFHGSALIAALLILATMAIFSQNRLSYIIVALVAIASSMVQTILLSGGPSSVVSFAFDPGFILQNVSFANILNYLLIVTGLTIVLAFVYSSVMMIFDIKKQRPCYRFLLFICFLAPLVFAFLFKVSVEMLANHKFIQVTLILMDIFVAGLLSNLLTIPFSIKSKEDKATLSAEESIIAQEPIQKKAHKKALPLPAFIAMQSGATLLAIALLAPLTLTGISEWAIYVNANRDTCFAANTKSELVDWIVDNTNESDVFLTPYWSFNRFFLAGRATYYGWPYYAYSAGHDTDTRLYNYEWLISGCNGNIDEFVRYCTERNIRYLVADDEFYNYLSTYNTIGYNREFFEQNLTPVAFFSSDNNTTIYRIY